MGFIKKEFTFPSASGLADIHAASYKPVDGECRAVLQIAHGMAEHIERYEGFIEYLCSNGIAVYTNDHIGHGLSAKNENELGYFGENDGSWKSLVDDCHALTKIAKFENPDKPYIFFGHSMGSFVARNYALHYGSEITGAVFCGTAGANPAVGAGIALSKMIIKLKGGHYRSKFIDNIAFGSYNKRCEGRTPFDWLTNDNDIVDAYIKDPHCGFLFTACGFRDMFELIASISSDSWYKELLKTLPVLIIAGAEDPVGEYGKGVTQVRDGLVAAGQRNVTMHLYEGCRHEILNESKSVKKVESDILSWIQSII